MTFQEIQELIKLLNKSNLSEFKLKDGEFQLSIRTSSYSEGKATQVVSVPAPAIPNVAVPLPVPIVATPIAPAHEAPATESATEAKAEKSALAPAPKAASAVGKTAEIKSPMVGTFYRAASPEKPAFVEIGSKVKKGDVVCVIEAMKLFNEIESEVSGTIIKVMTGNSQPVEYDQALFLVELD